MDKRSTTACSNMVVERRSGGQGKLEFEAWCQAKSTNEEDAFLKEYLTATKVAKRAVAQAQQAEIWVTTLNQKKGRVLSSR